MRNYIGLIHKDLDSDYGVSFPDFPGVVTAAATLDEARVMAEEALAFHVEGLEAEGEAIPEPSSLENIMTDPVNRDGVAILVALTTSPAKIIRVNITLPADVLAKIDEYADSRGLTRSGFILRLAKRALQTPAGEPVVQPAKASSKRATPHAALVTKRAGKKEKVKRRGPSLKKRVS
jgi:predicted RNase H-like HicB family nuclease